MSLTPSRIKSLSLPAEQGGRESAGVHRRRALRQVPHLALCSGAPKPWGTGFAPARPAPRPPFRAEAGSDGIRSRRKMVPGRSPPPPGAAPRGWALGAGAAPALEEGSAGLRSGRHQRHGRGDAAAVRPFPTREELHDRPA